MLNGRPMQTPFDPSLSELRLLHLADSAFPIGSLAHSFGLETLVDSGHLTVPLLRTFFHEYLEEAGVLEAVFCRAAFSLAQESAGNFDVRKWLELNDLLNALKPGREARAGSAALGENLLNAVLAVEDLPVLQVALKSARDRRDDRRTPVQHSLAFGLSAGALQLDETRAIFAFLHQSIASLISACQRLMPLGQTSATRILWRLKPAIIEAAGRSAETSVEGAACFTPLVDWGAMEHPSLTTRLFIS
jgi:urease accessory protein